jgi:hypothetical protein
MKTSGEGVSVELSLHPLAARHQVGNVALQMT